MQGEPSPIEVLIGGPVARLDGRDRERADMRKLRGVYSSPQSLLRGALELLEAHVEEARMREYLSIGNLLFAKRAFAAAAYWLETGGFVSTLVTRGVTESDGLTAHNGKGVPNGRVTTG